MNFNRNLRLLIALLIAALYAAAAQQGAAERGLPTADEINGDMKDLPDITGFRIRRQLPVEMVTRDQVNRYLKEQIKSTVKP